MGPVPLTINVNADYAPTKSCINSVNFVAFDAFFVP
jgi:hypothetical protein